ncbi:peroxiredoxin-like family protein [Nocardiopsis sp. RSe5-2]|uniref:Peroxiredoxin-like family protein n=1 Tax=Nocardiopsis endophytica TaxID=3018445 RepID=A0ABT4TXW5_9ACTN|nr:peroxiredoxin-like family protein [Nocardiopsis endophytica]MDA2809530.1 peroxiredoxin-like family protein [Nocardiopsis endophytica]
MTASRTARLEVGDTAPEAAPTTATGERLSLPDPDRIVHLQFRRFAGCPICHLHLHSFARRHADIEAAGVRAVAVFHSTADGLREYAENAPFDLVADPGMGLYQAYGVEAGPRSLLSPGAWPGIARGVFRAVRLLLQKRPWPTPERRPPGGKLGLPADFLIAPDGRILAAKYGAHANDQWSVDEVLARVPKP